MTQLTTSINGDVRAVASQTTVTDLVAELGVGPRGIAVSVNEALVPRSEWSSTTLQDQDRIEILHAVQGG